MGVDLGARRIGVALCDSQGILAYPLETVIRDGDGGLERIADLAISQEVKTVVVGMPISMNGRTGEAARLAALDVATLVGRLAPEGIDVVTIDERLTTLHARRTLAEAGRRPRRAGEVVDQVAAVIILQTWMDRESARKTSGRAT
jgi:putative Holliday junction resolvase